jgi:hypothetical protein
LHLKYHRAKMGFRGQRQKGGHTMAKVLGIHDIELQPGVSTEEFERAIRAVGGAQRGVKIYFARGDRGARAGKYIMVVEVESVERRDQLWPTAGMGMPTELSEELQRSMERIGPFADQQDVHTDYVVIEE